jgi:hypothetical protein
MAWRCEIWANWTAPTLQTRASAPAKPGDVEPRARMRRRDELRAARLHRQDPETRRVSACRRLIASLQKLEGQSYLLSSTLAASLDAVSALNDVCLEADRPRPAVELEEQATGIAKHRTGLVSPPQGSGAGRAILADRLQIVSQCSGHDCGGTSGGSKEKEKIKNWRVRGESSYPMRREKRSGLS